MNLKVKNHKYQNITILLPSPEPTSTWTVLMLILSSRGPGVYSTPNRNEYQKH
jgi:hypothetical protein